MTTIDHIEFEVSKLQLKPGDLLVVKSDMRMTPDQAKELREKAAANVPEGVKVMVLGEQLTVETIIREKQP